MRAREGDFIESVDSLIFDVKGFVHPPERVIAFIRYFPDKQGSRKRQGKAYGKVYSISERFEFLSKNYPEYVVYDQVFDEKLCEVPIQKVKHHYKPAEKLEELHKNAGNLDELESKALDFADLLKRSANTPLMSMGVSGSILVNLHSLKSDIDIIIYGVENCRKVHSALKNLLSEKNSPMNPYDRKDLAALFDFRSKDTVMSFENFVRIESRKVLQGKFSSTNYFVRLLKDWNEIDQKYGDVHYRNVGYAKIKATIVDDSEATFTPCTYKLKDVEVLKGPRSHSIEEIASFRGRFCEQAREGEAVVAQGKVERVTDSRRNSEHFRLLLGNKPSDYMVLS